MVVTEPQGRPPLEEPWGDHGDQDMVVTEPQGRPPLEGPWGGHGDQDMVVTEPVRAQVPTQSVAARARARAVT